MPSEPPPPYTYSKPLVEKPAPLTPVEKAAEQLALRKEEMKLGLWAEIKLKMENELELERLADNERYRAKQEARDNKGALDWVLEFALGFACAVLIFLCVAAGGMVMIEAAERMAYTMAPLFLPTTAPIRPTRKACSSASMSSVISCSSNSSSSTTPLTPRASSPAPSIEETPTAYEKADAALSKVSQEFAREIARLELEKVELQRQKADLQGECDKLETALHNANQVTEKKRLTEQERKRQEKQDAVLIAGGILLVIPVMFLAITILVTEWVTGVRMLLWAVRVARG
ncbi:hypothetical protein V492_04920 [Pseudogymnoascus sp. VKM F-4246]|nr:hypothetical protein V492_04920 [Pseudogymnoascus sp. VKM F-4246]